MVIIDLFKERDTGFVGAIGELVAWKYLSRHKKIECLSFRGDAKAFAGTWNKSSEYSTIGLSRQQVNYLVHMLRGIKSSERTYDFIGHRVRLGETCFRYLVEVKTTRQGRLPGTRKTAEEITKAKSLGFIPMLVHVEFLPDWKSKVTSKQL